MGTRLFYTGLVDIERDIVKISVVHILPVFLLDHAILHKKLLQPGDDGPGTGEAYAGIARRKPFQEVQRSIA